VDPPHAPLALRAALRHSQRAVKKLHFHRYTATSLNLLENFEFRPLHNRYRPQQTATKREIGIAYKTAFPLSHWHSFESVG
jgi:hypothetical protein